MLTGVKKSLRKGFTLVEIMIVVLIIGILLAVAIPNFVKARNSGRSKSCISNLRQIDAGKEQYMLDNKTTTAPSAMTSIVPTYVKNTPTCPSGGTYSINDATTSPSCTVGTNGTSDTNDDHQLAN